MSSPPRPCGFAAQVWLAPGQIDICARPHVTDSVHSMVSSTEKTASPNSGLGSVSGAEPLRMLEVAARCC